MYEKTLSTKTVFEGRILDVDVLEDAAGAVGADGGGALHGQFPAAESRRK